METRTLTRSHDKVLFGICGGIAEYFGWDAAMLRFLFIVVALFGGSSIVLYIILLFIMPKPDTPPELQRHGQT